MNVSGYEQICKICGAIENENFYWVKEMMFGYRDEFLYFQCKNCECLQIVGFPQNISKYYPEQYYSFKKYGEDRFKGISGKIRKITLPAAVFNKTIFNKLVAAIFPNKQFRIFHNLEITPHTRILDIGCGNGEKVLHPLAEIGFNAVTGCDPYIEDDICYPNGLKILKTDIFGMDGTWDIITYHHSFEHLEKPIANIEKVKSLLSNKGICIVRTPTVSSYAWRYYKTNWFQIDAPRHYFIPGIKTMQYIADQTGLALTKVFYDSNYKQFSESERYAVGIPLRQKREKGISNFIKRKYKKIRFKRMAKRLNKQNDGDQVAFYLMK